jgi:hypothetical protein
MTQPAMTQPNPFGNALWTGTNSMGQIDMDPAIRRVTGRDVLSQSLVRRQTTPLGSVVDSPNDCFDIRDWLSLEQTPAQIAQLQHVIQQELLKDQRVYACTAIVTYSGSMLTVVETIQSSYGPFTLTLSVSQVTLSVLVGNM